ncbi:type VI secretion system amidase effector protein Tae4 [Rodentibacter sp. Ppn85]|uniref:type VI secretion system amidase effector protein Tae4 n=1 Tax=Rodentibacter sp. Ppn85 TaxID=1908525 RepID=UPI0009CE3874|nr:type VI secretion system amidase effector protein Tae4 [Rodentibacter sp. Ppn85]OOF63367.1 hypothetical protein BKL51_08665 [Rodentibacter sp. Ppn85]
MKKIKVKTGDKESTLKINRPSWKNMFSHYKTMESAEFYSIVSSQWDKSAKSEDERVRKQWENTCAGRMSYALNHSGFILPKNPKGLAMIGEKDGYNHWLRVRELREYLKKSFGKGDVEYPLPAFNYDKNTSMDINEKVKKIKEKMDERIKLVKDNILEKIKGKKGIVVFEVSGWSNASGHFTLWDGEYLLYAPGHDVESTYEYYINGFIYNYYFWFVQETNSKIYQTNKIIFWELK